MSLKFTIEDRDGVAYLLGPSVARVATAEEVALWSALHEPQWSSHLTERYSRGGSTLCDKHDYIAAELRRISAKPQMTALRDSLYILSQVVAAAKRDGLAIEKGLQKRGAEANNLEDLMDRTARQVVSVLENAHLAIQLRRTERQSVAEMDPIFAVQASRDVEAMDRQAAEIQRTIDDLKALMIPREEGEEG